MRRNLLVVGVIASLLGLVFIQSAVCAQEVPKYGGILKIAVMSEPAHLDQHVVTSDLVDTIAQHMFETLFAFDEQWVPRPLLLESYDVSEDQTNWVFHLRKGVLFHNGKEMTSDDVVASLNRYIECGYRGGLIKQRLDLLAATDKYTVALNLTEPYGLLPALLSLHAVIYPEEIMKNAGAKPISPEEYIGTGPYRFVEWKPARYIKLVRFEGYQPPLGTPSGYVGSRTAYIDELLFIPIPESNTRVAGVTTGDYDFAGDLPTDLFKSLKASPGLETFRAEPPGSAALYFNMAQGLMSNIKLRQAVLAALDMEPIMEVAYAPGFWVAQGSMLPEGTFWYTTAGTEFYDQADPDKARALADEAGYAGEPIRIICTQDYADHYNRALAIREQLVNAGFNIDLQVYDWATLLAKRAQPDLWEIFVSGHCFYPDPALYTILDPRYPTHWDTPEKQLLMEKFVTTVSLEKRYEIWEDLQALLMVQLPWIKIGDTWSLVAFTDALKGFNTTSHPVIARPYFWNTWLDR